MKHISLEVYIFICKNMSIVGSIYAKYKVLFAEILLPEFVDFWNIRGLFHKTLRFLVDCYKL
jgi:hypothetical protein